jgi:hypothetical protein
MAGRGPAPKPAHLRARTNRKAGAAQLEAPDKPKIPTIPNPDGRTWHPLTLAAWKTAFSSPMAGEWLDTDIDAIGRLALLWDSFYQKPNPNTMKEIRLQGQLFGLSPLDRTRLQWEVNRAEESEQKQQRRRESPRRNGADPRKVLMMVKP